MSSCWCGGRIVNGHHCENGHLQYRRAPLLVRVVAGALLGVLAASPVVWGPAVFAQAVTVPVQMAVSWTPPAQTVDGQPLTGANAVKAYQLFVSQEAIPDASSLQPVVANIPPGATATTYSTSAPNGSTLYVRLKACNVGGCSAFSNQATKLVQVSVPGAPSGATVTVTVVVTLAP